MADATEITIISSDNLRFVIPSTAVALSAAITKKLGDATEVVLEKHDGKTLESVAEFLREYIRVGNDEDLEKRFQIEFLSENPPIEVLLRVVAAANDLEIPKMVDVVSEKIARVIENKSVNWVRNAFGIKGNLTEAEEEEIKAEYPFAFEGVEED